MTTANTLSLWDMTRGQQCLVSGFRDSLDERYILRLMEIGFHPGEKVTCLNTLAFGAPKVYQISNSVFSLDDTVASHIDAVPAPESNSDS